jgi:hypothetical protein
VQTLDGDINKRLRGANEMQLRSSFGLTNIQEGAGLNVRLLKRSFLEMTLRTGVGARHRLTRYLLQLTSEPGTSPQVYQLVPSLHRVGVEQGLIVVARITQWATGVIELDALVPFDDVLYTVVNVESNIAIKITEYISINYVLRYQRDATLSKDVQLENDLRLRFSFQFL